MSLNCSIYAFPKGKCWRRLEIGEAWVFDETLGKHGLDFVSGEPIEAEKFLDIITEAQDYESERILQKLKYVKHTLRGAIVFLNVVITRWGPKIPCMVYFEGYLPPKHPALDRLARRRQSRKEKERREQEAQDKVAADETREWLNHMKKCQWEGRKSPSLPEYLKGTR